MATRPTAAARTAGARAKRVAVNVEFESIGKFVREYVQNVSHSGAFVRSDEPLPIGTRVQLRFTVMMDDPEVLEGIGEVVRVSDRPRGMGVVFVSLEEHSKKLLAKLLTSPPRRTPPRR